MASAGARAGMVLVPAILAGSACWQYVAFAHHDAAWAETSARIQRDLGCDRAFGQYEGIEAVSVLDSATLSRIPDSHLVFAIVGYAEGKWKEELVAGRFQVAPRGVALLLAVAEVHFQVLNGGFNQYFYNYDGRSAASALEGYRMFGEEDRAALLQEALLKREAERPKVQALHEKRTIEAFSASYEESDLGGIDDRYFADTSCLWEGAVRAIRRNPALFLEG